MPNFFEKRLSNTMRNMPKLLKILPQYIAPQRALGWLARVLAGSRKPWLKNYLIGYFVKRHPVNMHDAIIENPYDYPCFNSFFTRRLKPEFRPIVQGPNEIACPVDGSISQIGKIEKDTLLQAKGFNYNLKALLGGSAKLSKLFEDGNFATFYLAPKDYHRVHMPIDGKLRESIFIPGKLFSVSQETANAIPNLFTRNERLVCIFDTAVGPMAVILVGAMIVGSINTVWYAKTDTPNINVESFGGSIELDRGKELGLFKLGSTVIVLFGKDKVTWSSNLKENALVLMGQNVGTIHTK
jgi:phosphatidylserine decarboxylase